MASCAAVASPRRDGVPPLRPLPRGGLLGAIERLSPRQASQSPARAAAGASPRVTPNKIRTLQDRRPGGAPTGSGAEPPAACSPLAAAEAHERLVGAVCEAVREAAREEVREQMREATGALQDAVRSEVSLALRASPGAGSGRQAVLFARKPGGDVHMPPLKYTSGELQAGLIREDSTRDSPVSGTSKKVTSSHHTFWSEERAKHLSSFAERQGRTEVIETGPAIKWIERLNYWWKLKEPKRHGKLADLFDNDWFEVSVQVIIMLNCVFMAIVANSEVANLDEDPHPIILPLEIAFQVIYTIELVAKLYVHRLYFFWNEDSALNILDFTLVFTGALDIALRLSNLWNVTYFRSLRVVKVAKALRLVRVITGAVQLRNIFICIIGSLMNLIWSIVMLAVVLYMFSLGMVISAATHLQEMGEGTTDSAESLREDLLSMYGSVQQSMLTLYQATTGGEDWSVSFDTISSTGWVASVVYLMFVSFMHIALVNIITGIFVDTALERLAPDREAMALNHRKEEELVAEELRALWREVAGGDDFLSAEDFHEGITGDKIPPRLQHMGLSVDNVNQFFGALWKGSEDGNVRINSFVGGCMRLKGSASSFDIQELRSEVFAIGRKVDRVGLGLIRE